MSRIEKLATKEAHSVDISIRGDLGCKRSEKVDRKEEPRSRNTVI